MWVLWCVCVGGVILVHLLCVYLCMCCQAHTVYPFDSHCANFILIVLNELPLICGQLAFVAAFSAALLPVCVSLSYPLSPSHTSPPPPPPPPPQVHSFCCTLLEGVLSYKEKSKSDDTSILRTLQTQPSAMLSAIGVMAEQCQIRLQDLEGNQQRSIMRNTGLQALDSDLGKPPSPVPKVHSRPPPPQPPGAAKRVEEVQCVCMCVYTCMCVYICCVCTCMCVLCVCVYCVCTCMYVCFLFVYVCVYACMCVWHICACVDVDPCIYVFYVCVL